MSAQPITPDEVVTLKRTIIPEGVIIAFNELIAEHWDGHSAHFSLSDAAQRVQLATGLTHDELTRRHYLDVEDIYREAGWTVVYDQPGYNESYTATFRFTRP